MRTGDFVRIVKSSKGLGPWCPKMDQHIGEYGKVLGTLQGAEDEGDVVETGIHRFFWPYECLEIVK